MKICVSEMIYVHEFVCTCVCASVYAQLSFCVSMLICSVCMHLCVSACCVLVVKVGDNPYASV